MKSNNKMKLRRENMLQLICEAPVTTINELAEFFLYPRKLSERTSNFWKNRIWLSASTAVWPQRIIKVTKLLFHPFHP